MQAPRVLSRVLHLGSAACLCAALSPARAQAPLPGYTDHLVNGFQDWVGRRTITPTLRRFTPAPAPLLSPSFRPGTGFRFYKEISERLNISVPTVNTYIRRMYEKLHVRSRAQAVAKYAHLSNPEERPHLPARP